MRFSWTWVIGIAFLATFLVTIFDLFYAVKGDSSLVQYEVTPIEPTLNTSVFFHMAETAPRINVRSDEIGVIEQNDLTQE